MMKQIILLIVLIALGAVYYFKFYDAPPVKAFKEYRKQQIQAEANQPMPALARDLPKARLGSVKITIDNKQISGDSATLEATEFVVWLPEVCSSTTCGTWDTKKWSAQLQKSGNVWSVVSATLLSEERSTASDRR